MKNYCLLLTILLIALCACRNDSFKIDGNLTGLDGTAVHVVFRGDSGVVDQWANIDKKGRFSFKATASQPVIVTMSDQKGETLTTVVACNGDHIKIKGDASKAMGVKAGGNRVNDEWQLFRDEHAAFYTDTNPSRLDAAIEKYVKEHPDDMLSTLLLLVDYSDFTDRDKMVNLLKSINTEARPESLTMAFPGELSTRKNVSPRLMSLTLMRHNGDFEEIKLTDRITLISLWANPQNDRTTLIDKLTNSGKEIRIVDVLAEADTLRWHQTIAQDPTEWGHYWAPGGPLDQGIKLLGITSMPWFAVIDSAGLVAYSGPDLATALNSAR